jgi:hypothetical protein
MAADLAAAVHDPRIVRKLQRKIAADLSSLRQLAAAVSVVTAGNNCRRPATLTG